MPDEIRDICGYTVIADPKGHYVEFAVFTEIETVLNRETLREDGEAEFIGSIKWDGCSNWDFNASTMMHFCSKGEAEDLGVLLGRLYEWAAELMPEYKEHILSSINDADL